MRLRGHAVFALSRSNTKMERESLLVIHEFWSEGTSASGGGGGGGGGGGAQEKKDLSC